MPSSPYTSIASALLVALLATLPSPARAHPVIGGGDVAVVAIETGGVGGPASFAFVALVPFHPFERVRFTDRGWLASGAFRAGEGEAFWDVVRPYPAGSVVEMSGAMGVSLDPGADQVFAYVGELMPDGTPTDTLIFGLNLGGPWQSDATSTTTSALPPSLTGFEVALGTFLACAYTGPTVGTKAELLARIVDPAQWTCSDTEPVALPGPFTVYLDRGATCSADAECAPGLFCAYGVCCDSPCRRDEAFHCATCEHGPAGDPRNGTCGPAPSTYLCRLGRGPCDPMDHCDGASMECPPNVLLDATTVCRASSGGCDPAEVCTGLSPECPADARAEIGSPCRPARGACDVEERCEGALTCPPDAVVPDGTACDDGLACTTAEQCLGGLCAGPVPVECDDGDACTADACADDGGCTNVPIAGCCARDADCDDDDACTLDACGADGWCLPAASVLCRDAGAPGADAGVAAPPPEAGCACRAAPGPARGAAHLAWLLAIVSLLRRRARRR